MEWFRHRRISDHVIEIMDITDVRMFLVEGKCESVLIDTGAGIGDLYGYLEELTKRPVKVFLTHGHVDHVGCAYQFENVYIHPKDISLYGRHSHEEIKRGYIQATAGNQVSQQQLEAISSQRVKKFKYLKDGEVYDLGGVSLEVVEVAGHTEGMCSLLIKEDQAMIYGDACNERVFLFSEEACDLKTYRESLQHLKSYDFRYKKAWFSHGPVEQTREILDGCLRLTEEIMQGQDDKVPFTFMGQEAFTAKKTGDDGILRLDGQHGNIVYSQGKL